MAKIYSLEDWKIGNCIQSMTMTYFCMQLKCYYSNLPINCYECGKSCPCVVFPLESTSIVGFNRAPINNHSNLSKILNFAWWKYDMEKFAVTPCNDFL